jgi:hypothetical protein
MPAALFGEHALVMIKDAARHKYLRTLITPAYTPDAIAGLVPRMEAVVAKYLKRWADYDDAKGGRVMVYEELKLFIMAVSAPCLLQLLCQCIVVTAHQDMPHHLQQLVANTSKVSYILHVCWGLLCCRVCCRWCWAVTMMMPKLHT